MGTVNLRCINLCITSKRKPVHVISNVESGKLALNRIVWLFGDKNVKSYLAMKSSPIWSGNVSLTTLSARFTPSLNVARHAFLFSSVLWNFLIELSMLHVSSRSADDKCGISITWGLTSSKWFLFYLCRLGPIPLKLINQRQDLSLSISITW